MPRLEFRRVVQHEIVADDPRFPALGRRRPLELDVGLARPHPRAPGLTTGQDRDVELTGLDLRGGRVDEALRALTAHRGVRGLGRRQTQLLRNQECRIAVLPGQQIDDPQRLGIGIDRRPASTVALPIAEHISRLGRAPQRGHLCAAPFVRRR